MLWARAAILLQMRLRVPQMADGLEQKEEERERGGRGGGEEEEAIY